MFIFANLSGRRLPLKIFILALLALSIFGCGAQPQNRSLQAFNFSGVINGDLVSPEKAASQGLVLIEFYRTNSGGEVSTAGFCSGTLIGPQTVLTAAHCLDTKLLHGVTKTKIIFEVNREPNSNPRALDVVSSSAHPLYNSETIVIKNMQASTTHPKKKTPVLNTYSAYDHDIAILVFKGTAPSEYKIAQLDTDARSDRAGLNEKVYGFGRSANYSGKKDEPLVFSSGILRSGYLQIKSDYSESKDRYFVQQNSNQQSLCQGDSGGPHFLSTPSGDQLIGVSSASLGATFKNGRKSCSQEGQVTKVAPFYAWIQNEEKKLLNNQEHQ